MAGLKQAIQSLLARCETITGVAHCRVWNNQVNIENEGQTYDFPKPAIFIEARTDFMPIGGGYSQSDTIFAVHIVHEQFDAGGGTFEQNFDVYDLRAAVIKSLTGFKPDMCSGLMKIRETPDNDHTNIYHYIIEFLCGLIDDAGVQDTTTSEPPTGLEINIDVKDSISGQTNEQYRKVNKL